MFLPKLNLQMFAIEDIEDIEIESLGGPDEEEEYTEDFVDEDDDSEDVEDVVDVEDIEDEEDNPSLDKKTKAIIRHKKENQALKKQLQELQDKMQEKELQSETNDRIVELTREGKTSTEATRIATDESELKKLRLTIANMELSQLETKYPGISNYSKQLSESKARMPEFSYEQLYLANYSKQNTFDMKTKLEQEIAYKNRNAADKSLSGSNTKQTKATTLSQADERVYQYLKKSKPSLTRKQFLQTLNTGEMDL